jgi:hypothetical protein
MKRETKSIAGTPPDPTELPSVKLCGVHTNQPFENPHGILSHADQSQLRAGNGVYPVLEVEATVEPQVI